MACHPSKFCWPHAPDVSSLARPQRPPSKKSFNSRIDPVAPCCNRKTLAHCKNCSLSIHNKPCLEAIQSTISERVVSSLTDDQHTPGVRCLVAIHETVLQETLPLLLFVVAQASKVVAFPLKDPLIHKPVLVVAPKASLQSDAWTKGTLHRDFDCTETPGLCSFLSFSDEVTPDNGTVAFWRHSKLIGPIDPRHPERALDQAGLTSKLFLGKAGTVHARDSRLLHGSLANRTQNRRLALQWMVASAGRNGVSLSVSTSTNV